MKKILGIIATVVVLAVVVSVGLKVVGFGFGKGGGTGNGTSESVSVKDKYDKKDIIIVKVDESTIYVDDEKCKDVEAMKDKISKIEASGNKKTYIFEHEYAIKDTSDEVSEVLHSLQETLGISVEYDE